VDPSLEHDLVNLDHVLRTTQGYASQWLAHLNEHHAAVPPVALERAALPERGRGFAAALADFQARWAPGFSGSAGPRYLGFVTGGATPAALAGDWLTGTFDQNPTSALDSSAPDLERETVGWLRELFGLSKAHHGAFVTGATMSNMVGLAIAREWAGEVKGVQIAEQGVAALGPVRVLSGAPHSSIYKGLSMLGLGRAALTSIPLQPGREAVELLALERALQACGEQPVIVVANAGTVNTADFDDLAAIAQLKHRYPFWLHVDGAFGSFAALSPQHTHWVAGLDAADSLCVDCHKWLNVPYDSAVQFTRRRDLQVRVFQNSAAYLGLPDSNPDFVHLTPENSRRLRALASWFSLAAYGREGHRDIVERNVAGARALGELLARSTIFKLLAPVTLNVVCFTLANAPTQDRIQAFLRQVAEDGVLFLTPTVLHGTWAIRAAFSNWRTTEDDVERIHHAIEAAYRDVSL
jgi:glutamate/tyrosine decarboxylase-like PLP-dependent enzyme